MLPIAKVVLHICNLHATFVRRGRVKSAKDGVECRNLQSRKLLARGVLQIARSACETCDASRSVLMSSSRSNAFPNMLPLKGAGYAGKDVYQRTW